MSVERNTDYPHDGVIGWNDPFWQTLDREWTDEDFYRQSMTAAEYEALILEADKQDRFANDGMHNASPEEQEAWLVLNGYAQPGDLLGYIPGTAGDPYYGIEEWCNQMWEQAIEQANQGNYLETL